MTVAARHARLATAVVRHHGQTVTRADGSTFTGVFDRFAPRAVKSPDGRVMRLEQQPNPTIVAQAADVASLAAGDIVTCDGEDWALARAPEPDGYGLSTLYLMPAPTDSVNATFRRWR
jgi:hypothetical protein